MLLLWKDCECACHHACTMKKAKQRGAGGNKGAQILEVGGSRHGHRVGGERRGVVQRAPLPLRKQLRSSLRRRKRPAAANTFFCIRCFTLCVSDGRPSLLRKARASESAAAKHTRARVGGLSSLVGLIKSRLERPQRGVVVKEEREHHLRGELHLAPLPCRADWVRDVHGHASGHTSARGESVQDPLGGPVGGAAVAVARLRFAVGVPSAAGVSAKPTVEQNICTDGMKDDNAGKGHVSPRGGRHRSGLCRRREAPTRRP